MFPDNQKEFTVPGGLSAAQGEISPDRLAAPTAPGL
jgi:hypothetical protein